MAERVAPALVLAIDRSARAIAPALAASRDAIAGGHLFVRQVAAEDCARAPAEAPFDLIVAVRVGALDGRRPQVDARAWPRMSTALAPGGQFVVDGARCAIDEKHEFQAMTRALPDSNGGRR